MSKIIDAVYMAYIQNEVEGISPAHPMSKDEEKLDKFLNSVIPKDRQLEHDLLRIDVNCEHDAREFKNAFRIGFMLCAEVFLNE